MIAEIIASRAQIAIRSMESSLHISIRPNQGLIFFWLVFNEWTELLYFVEKMSTKKENNKTL